MQNIHVKRYAKPELVGYQGTIEPEDGSWLLFVPNKGLPQLWGRGLVRDKQNHTELEYRPVLPSNSDMYWYAEDQSHSTETHYAFVEHNREVLLLRLWRHEGHAPAPVESRRKDGWNVQWLCSEVHFLEGLDIEEARTAAVRLLHEHDGKYSEAWLQENKHEVMETQESLEEFYERMKLPQPE